MAQNQKTTDGSADYDNQYQPEYAEYALDEKTLEELKVGSLLVKEGAGFPLTLDIDSEVHNILAAGIFKNIESVSLYNKVCEMMLSERFQNMAEALFWCIYMIKYQKNDEELLKKLQKHLGKLYSEYFSLLPQPKEDLSHMGIFASAYLCHIMFFNVFQSDRKLFDMRFILDCYHIVIHEANGIFVSDIYVQNTIEKLFGSKFFQYEKRGEKKKKVEKKDFRNEPLLRHLSYDLKHLPEVSGGLDLAQELASKLRKAPKRNKNLTPAEMNETQNKSTLSSSKQIMKLTQPNQDKSYISESKSEPKFPIIKFNCNQISPTVSNYLDSSNILPFQQRKIVNLTNNKQITEIPQYDFHSNLESAKETVVEKKDKKKAQPKGTINDYNLQNRSEDYYLGYLAKDMKKKFKFALDMKYILDNIKPSLKGDSMVKSFSEEQSKKAFLTLSALDKKAEIKEEEEDEEIKDSPEVTYIGKEEFNLTDVGFEQESFRKDKKDTQEEQANDLTLPAITSKLLLRLREESTTQSRRNSKRSVMFPRLNESRDMNRDKLDVSQNQTEVVKSNSYSSQPFKYKSTANKNLGKGRFFVNLAEQKEEPDPEFVRRFGSKKAYQDKRREYVAEHDKLIRKDVDANIEGLVQKLLLKQNQFNRNFGKYIR